MCSTPLGIEEAGTSAIGLDAWLFSRAQRLWASKKRALWVPTGSAPNHWCSTPLGIEEAGTAAVTRYVALNQMCSTPLGIEEAGTSWAAAPFGCGQCAQRLWASKKRARRPRGSGDHR